MNNLAFVFPGQGSQTVGMINALYEDFPEIQHVFSRASDVLNINLLEIVQSDPNDILNHTEITQPALLTCSVAMWEVWKTQTDIVPKYMAGHSLGEYSALVCSGAMKFEDAVLLTNKRGQYMQQAVPTGKGAMAAILGLTDQQVVDICNQVDDKRSVSAANFNSPGQVVISGKKKSVEKASELARLAGAMRIMPLAVSVPSHCRLMRPAAELLEEDLIHLDLSTPTIPVIHNVNVKAHQSPDKIKKSLVKQLFQSVKWTQTMEFFRDNSINNIIECGPNKVLSGLVKRFDKNLTINNLNNKQGLEKALESLRGQ
jgi:[acyl-carrier-protein] S-malonyltransferase